MIKRMKTKNRKYSPIVFVFTVVLILYCLSLIIPFIWGLFSSVKGNIEFSLNVFGLPKGKIWEWKWSNYADVFNNFTVTITDGENRYQVNMLTMIFNSIVYSVGCSLMNAFVPCLVAYLITKFPYRLSKIIYATVVVAIVIPIIGNNISMLQLLKKIGLYDNMFGMFIMSFSFLSIYLLVFCASFKGVSVTYSEAAVIDGANNFTIFFKIVFPLVRSAFFTIFLLFFISRWNDYYTPMLYVPSSPTLAYGLYFFNNSTQTTLDWPPMKIAGCMILVLPILTIFLIFRNRIMGNVSMGGIKE